MDRSDQILEAIETLGRAVDAKIESTAAELRNEFRTEIKRLESEMKGELARVEDGVRAEFRGEIKRLEGEMKTEFRVVNARLDEQRQTINALIPQRIAAVGRNDAAE